MEVCKYTRLRTDQQQRGDWVLPDGREVVADSSVNGGGVRVLGPCQCGLVGCLTVVAAGYDEVSAIVGGDHPAIVASMRATDAHIEAQSSAGRDMLTCGRWETDCAFKHNARTW